MKTFTALLFVLLIAALVSNGSSSTATEATECCAAKGRVGRYAHADPTKYYYCYLYGGQLLGQVYTCSGVTTFDDCLGMCTVPVAE